MTAFKIVSTLLLLAVSLQLSEQLMCFSCSEGFDVSNDTYTFPKSGFPDISTEPCGDLSSTDLLVDCGEYVPYCLKIDLSYEQSDGVVVNGTVRLCGTSDFDACEAVGDIEGILTDCYSCDKDGCNSANSIAAYK